MNLRKDHCRNLHSRPRTLFGHGGAAFGGAYAPPSSAPPPPAGAPRCAACGLTNPGAERAKENRNGSPGPLSRPVRGARGLGARCVSRMSKRLSATDISALASMKNVAKCDTWCELQNPVNHRVFERKLRPKPSGRGHACLGVTHRVAPPPPLEWSGCGGGGEWPPVRPSPRGWPKFDPPAAHVATSGG